jgi:hypothetical protein
MASRKIDMARSTSAAVVVMGGTEADDVEVATRAAQLENEPVFQAVLINLGNLSVGRGFLVAVGDEFDANQERIGNPKRFSSPADTGQPVMSARGRVPRARRRALGARRREMSAAGPKGDHLFSTQIVSHGIPSVLLTRDHAPAFPW